MIKSLAFLLTIILASPSSFAKPEKYTIDPAHSSVVFSVDHLGFSTVYGMFEDVSGTLMIDEKDPSKSSIELSIKAASIDTNVKKRDDHLRSPDFFNAKQFPNMTFKSESIEKVSGNKYKAMGTFEMHGVKKKMGFTFERHRTGKDPWGKTRTGGSTEFTLKRSEYGMNYMIGKDQVGDVVSVIVSLEAVKE